MKRILLFLFILNVLHLFAQDKWSTDYVYFGEDGKLTYTPDEQGNVIPDFSHVGYRFGDELIPDIPATVEVSPVEGDDGDNIQAAIESLYGSEPDKNGFRGCVLLKKGEYQISGQITIEQSGIVLQGEGNGENGTVLWATGDSDRSLVVAGNNSSLQIDKNTAVDVVENYVPLGRRYVIVENASAYGMGDLVVIYRPGTADWISAIKMDKITSGTPGDPTQQWSASSYSFYFERTLTKVSGDTLFFRNPVVMALDKEYGGGKIYKASFDRLENIGIQNMALKSEYDSKTDEDHSWRAVVFNEVKNGWAKNLKSWYFAYSCVSINRDAKMISVIDCACYEPKSLITGARRYSFYCEGQLNLFKGCETTEGRHDYITGSRVCGPNVFTQSTAREAHNDIGPHHRWSMGTLYDQIDTDGDINVQDRDDMGSGHGWSGANQVFWNCIGSGSVCQSPWASAKNYNFGFIGKKLNGYRSGRPDGVWVGHNKPGLFPASLYATQLSQRLNSDTVFSCFSKLEQHNDSVYLMHFNLPLDESTIVQSNFEIGGTAGFDDQLYSISVVDDYTVEFTFTSLGVLPSLSTISIVANNVLSESRLLLTGLNSSNFLIPDERPEVEGAELTTDNESGSFAVAKSSKEGFLYLILIGEPVATVADFELAADKYKAVRAEVKTTGVSVPIYTKGLHGGVYRYYAVDNSGRISAPSQNVVVINATGPVTLSGKNKLEDFNWFINNGVLTIEPPGDYDEYHLGVYGYTGKKIIRQKKIKGIYQFEMPVKSTGVLIIQIVSGKSILTSKVIY